MAIKEQRTITERINIHEAECAQRYKNIEARLESGAIKFDKLEKIIWGVYPFILVLFIVQNFGG
jgi:hypothetical protein